MLGKRLNTLNKLSPNGRRLQKGINKLSENGTADRIGNAVNKRKQTTPLGLGGIKAGASAEGKNNESSLDRREVEDQTSDGGEINLKATAKFLKIAFPAMIAVIVFVIFVGIFMIPSMAVESLFGIGGADEASNNESKWESQLGNIKEDDIDEKNSKSPQVFDYDLFIDDDATKFRNSKLKKIRKVREYNEADIAELKDYYPNIDSYIEEDETNGNKTNMSTVYTFFFKLHYLYFHYYNKYKVELDMPLLMATLTVREKDMNIVFRSNIIGYGQKQLNKKSDNDRFDYDKYIDYVSSNDEAEYDIEILAQYMVSKVAYDPNNEKDTCTSDKVVDGICYKIDYERYDEFLKEYLEKKYITGGRLNSSYNDVVYSEKTCVANAFTKYNLTDDQVAQLASLAYQEQGTIKGAAAEASLMANLFEKNGRKYGEGAEGLYNYVRNSGWFAYASKHMDARKASSEVIAAVKSVLVDGKRTLPGYIDEHDWINDLSNVSNDGVEISRGDRASYIKNKTKLKNIYGSTYTFYSFPDTNSDPFGYTSEKRRKEIGDFYYDFDTGQPVNCSSSTGNQYAEALIDLANSENLSNADKDGSKYNTYFGYVRPTPWCANFVSYLISNASVNDVAIYPNIIDFRSPSVRTLISNFNNSTKTNIKFYYNDNCSNLSGKNGGDGAYTPKPGDFIFFDWEAQYTDISSNTQDHVGIVEKYQNGIIYTIEGNSGVPGRVKKQTYNISSCKVIGFGSWY